MRLFPMVSDLFPMVSDLFPMVSDLFPMVSDFESSEEWVLMQRIVWQVSVSGSRKFYWIRKPCGRKPRNVLLYNTCIFFYKKHRIWLWTGVSSLFVELFELTGVNYLSRDDDNPRRRLLHTQHWTQNRTSWPLKYQRTTNTTATLVVKY